MVKIRIVYYKNLDIVEAEVCHNKKHVLTKENMEPWDKVEIFPEKQEQISCPICGSNYR